MLNDGSTVGGFSGDKHSEQALRDREDKIERLTLENEALYSREQKLQDDIASLNGKIASLAASLAAMSNKCEQSTATVEKLRQENSSLNATLAKVSPEELKRIHDVEQRAREAERERLTHLRRTMVCSCAGAVENCRRCFGSGKYEVDGYGNPV
jgi:predicted nuclease with TOPRIM domain